MEAQNGLDFGESVDPGEDGFGGFAVLEAVVEVFADGMGKTSNFAGSIHRSGMWGCEKIAFVYLDLPLFTLISP